MLPEPRACPGREAFVRQSRHHSARPAMKSIINLFWGICLLRQSPAAVPGQGAFVAIVVAANLVVSVGVSLSLAESPGVMRTVTGIVVGQAVTASLVWLVL